jgi:hypothetical protein
MRKRNRIRKSNKPDPHSVDIAFLISTNVQSSQLCPGCNSQSTTTLAPKPTAGIPPLTRGPKNPPYIKWTAEQPNANASSATEKAAEECRCGVVSTAGSSRAISATNVARNEFPWQVKIQFILYFYIRISRLFSAIFNLGIMLRTIFLTQSRGLIKKKATSPSWFLLYFRTAHISNFV